VEKVKLERQVRAEVDKNMQIENLNSIISHEIKTPIETSIQFLDLITSSFE